MPSKEWIQGNPRVAAYISEDLYRRLIGFMGDRNIKSISQALVVILNEYFDVPQPTIAPPDRLAELEARIVAIEQKLATPEKPSLSEFFKAAHDKHYGNRRT